MKRKGIIYRSTHLMMSEYVDCDIINFETHNFKFALIRNTQALSLLVLLVRRLSATTPGENIIIYLQTQTLTSIICFLFHSRQELKLAEVGYFTRIYLFLHVCWNRALVCEAMCTGLLRLRNPKPSCTFTAASTFNYYAQI